MTPRTSLRAALAVLSVAALSACGSDAESSATTASTSASTVPTTAATSAPATTAAPTTSTPTTARPATTAPPTTTDRPVSPTTAAASVTPTTAAPPLETTPSGEIVIAVTVGVDSSPDRVESVPLGSTVTLQMTDPTADQEYHVHGYDLGGNTEVPAGVTSRITFTADKAGSFEVESHITEDVLFVLEVQ